MINMSDSAAKLSKKQRKTLDFRTKNVDKPDKAATAAADDEDGRSVGERKGGVVVDKQEELKAKVSKGKKKDGRADKGEIESTRSGKAAAGKGSTTDKSSSVMPTASIKKRKRDSSTGAEAPVRTKKRFDEHGQLVEGTEEEEETVDESKADTEEERSKRYIVFVGNMAYKTTAEEIAKHFAEHCTEKPTVRLLTSKGDPTKAQKLSKSKQKSIAKGKALDPGAPQSKGCAFVEFETREGLQKALQFHHTQLHGRSINVELTAGGGGKSATRKERIEKKNRELESERKKLHEKYVKTGAASAKRKAKESGEGESEQKEQQAMKEVKPQWGPNAAKGRLATKVPRWAASGANAIRLNG